MKRKTKAQARLHNFSAEMRNKCDGFVPTMVGVFLFSLIGLFSCTPTNAEHELKTYIIHVQKPMGVSAAKSDNLHAWYKSAYPEMFSCFGDQERLVYSYKNVLSGFAAKLTKEEAEAMKEKKGFISAIPERKYSLHTTHSPAFIGLQKNSGFWNQTNYGKGIIIASFDTGVTPDHPSFHDDGMPSPPEKWKGTCELPNGCNKKIIGARNFVQSLAGQPPLDDDGHGTHTSSTAAGSFVQDAEVYGNAQGTAVGIAPLAHLAIYKVCSAEGCLSSDMLAAIDTAIEDGADILSFSLGSGTAPFYEDATAIGSFSAIQNGIFVSSSAGNEGPGYLTLSNEAPWLLTTGATSTDRSIIATAKIGTGEEFDGESLFQPTNYDSETMLPLIYAGTTQNDTYAFCGPGSLKNLDVKGKIVLCERGADVARMDKGQEVKDNGGAAMILMNDEENAFSTLADPHVLPATHVSYTAGVSIKAYINSTSNPTATILFKSTHFGEKTAPAVGSFSSRGPNYETPGILKPDIVGPGVSIVAAWPISVDNRTNGKATFNVVSGTSMSCPHLSGIAALLKSAHPDWSPAAIKSAMMTTADTVNLAGQPIVDETNQTADLFSIGAGHVNPEKANDPGLIYDNKPEDYIPYLCGLNYADTDIQTIVQQPVQCSTMTKIAETELNYPSFSLIISATNSSQSYHRTVTNVGPANSHYTVDVKPPEAIEVTVEPTEISFTEVNQKVTYTVTFTINGNTADLEFSQGSLRWASDKHTVTSPIAIIFDDGET